MADFSVNIKFDDAITSMVEELSDEVENLKDEAFDVFVENTPKRTGNARRNTRKSKDEIRASYPYAKRLDEGYSKKSPKGMTEPTLDYIDKRFKEIVKGR